MNSTRFEIKWGGDWSQVECRSGGLPSRLPLKKEREGNFIMLPFRVTAIRRAVNRTKGPEKGAANEN